MTKTKLTAQQVWEQRVIGRAIAWHVSIFRGRAQGQSGSAYNKINCDTLEEAREIAPYLAIGGAGRGVLIYAWDGTNQVLAETYDPPKSA